MANHPSGSTSKARHPHDKRRPESAGVKLGVEIYREEGNIEPLRHSLSPRQRAFCEEYIVDFNGSAAVIRAGYSIKWSDRQASMLMKNAGVAAYIDYLTGSSAAKVTAIDPDYVIQKVTEIITKAESKDGDKLRGLELLARHLGMFVDKVENKVTVDTVERQRTEEEANNFTNALKALRDRAVKEEKETITLV
jgi:phage terminase small subunit